MLVLTIALPAIHQELQALRLLEHWKTLEVQERASFADALAQWEHATPALCFAGVENAAAEAQAFLRHLRQNGDATPVYAVVPQPQDALEDALFAAGVSDCIAPDLLTPAFQAHLLVRARRDAARTKRQLEHELFFEMMENDVGIGIWQWDPRTDRYRWSARQFQLFGMQHSSNADISYLGWRDAIHPDDRERIEAELSRAMVGVSRYDSVFRMNASGPDGHPRWLAGVGRVQRDRSGAAVRVVGLNWDVSARCNAQLENMRALGCGDCLSHATPNVFQQYFKQASDCLFHIELGAGGDLRYTAINPAAAAQLGVQGKDVIGKTPLQVLGGEAGTVVEAGIRAALKTGNPYSHKPEFDLQHGLVVFDAVYMPIADESGRYTSVLGSVRDITAQRGLQVSLLQAQKMEALGQFASGVAHDFNNILQNASNLFELIGFARDPVQTAPLLKRGRALIACGQALTSRLLAFARKEAPASRVLDPNAVIEHVVDILRVSVGSGVEIALALAPATDIWPVEADPTQLDLVLINLAVNARDAMNGTGKIIIKTDNVRVQADRDGILEDGDYVLISFADNGMGMPPPVLARATQPFFTTKPAGHGTGLGLSMICEHLRSLRGDCKLASEVGAGTCVSLYLPRAR